MKYENVFRLGNTVMVRTVTYHYIGKICDIIDKKDGDLSVICLSPAGWLANSGDPLFDILQKGLSERAGYEPIPGGVAIMAAAIIDVVPWDHVVPLQRIEKSRTLLGEELTRKKTPLDK